MAARIEMRGAVTGAALYLLSTDYVFYHAHLPDCLFTRLQP